MAVDDRLRRYFRAVYSFHRTGEKVWLKLLSIYAGEPPSPGSNAARHFLYRHLSKEKKVDTS